MEILEWLCNWYSIHCDGDWEHDKRIRVATIDNPGWSVDINIENTEIEEKTFEKLVIEKSENDWIHCCIKDCVFQGRGGSKNLIEILDIFKDFVTKNS